MNPEEYEVMFRVEDCHWWYVGLRGVLRQFWRRYVRVSEPQVLDVGCGTGAVLKTLGGGDQATGVDFAAEAIGFCRKRGIERSAVASALALPFDANRFDVVISFDVLCHSSIPDKNVVIGELCRVVKPGGMLLLNVPAYQWLRSSHDVAVHTDHRFTKPEILELLRANELEPLRVAYWNTLLFPAIVVARLWRKLSRPKGSDLEIGSGQSLNEILGAVLALERRIMRAVPLPFGLSIFAVARKPRRNNSAAP